MMLFTDHYPLIIPIEGGACLAGIDRIIGFFYSICNVENTLSQRIEILFAELGINQMDFARITGFGQSYISQILSGSKSSPSARFYNAVCHEFNVNPEWLKNGKGEVFTLPGGAVDVDADILAKYRRLPKTERRLIEDMINALLAKSMGDNQKTKKKK